MLLLDTDAVPVADRAEYVKTAMERTTAPCVVRFAGQADGVQARISAWRLGDAFFWRNEATAMSMTRSSRHVRQDVDGRVSFAIQERGAAVFRYADEGVVEVPDDTGLIVSDLTQPYEYAQTAGSAFCISVPAEMLGLAGPVTREAALRLPTSPVYRLFHRHLSSVARRTDAFADDPRSAEIGAASIDLLRALLAALNGERARRAGLAEALKARIGVYIDQHLRDPDLSAASIAVAHSVSVRTVYNACAAAGFTPEDEILRRRIARAAEDLRSPAHGWEPVLAIAERYRFRDGTHFSRRFKQQLGVTPSEWRRRPST